MSDENTPQNAAQVGSMFVTKIEFHYHKPGSEYNYETKKHEDKPGRWSVQAELNSRLDQYSSGKKVMAIDVTVDIGQQLAAILLPVIIADASRKAQALADESKAMLEKLGDRAIKCLNDMPGTVAETTTEVLPPEAAE